MAKYAAVKHRHINGGIGKNISLCASCSQFGIKKRSLNVNTAYSRTGFHSLPYSFNAAHNALCAQIPVQSRTYGSGSVIEMIFCTGGRILMKPCRPAGVAVNVNKAGHHRSGFAYHIGKRGSVGCVSGIYYLTALHTYGALFSHAVPQDHAA